MRIIHEDDNTEIYFNNLNHKRYYGTVSFDCRNKDCTFVMLIMPIMRIGLNTKNPFGTSVDNRHFRSYYAYYAYYAYKMPPRTIRSP